MFSGHISLFFPELLRNIPKESYPVFPAWDGSGHYAPTKILSVDRFHQWKIKCQVPRYLLGASMILKEINHQYLTPEQVQAANKVEKVIMESVQVLEPSLVAELGRQNPPSTGPRASQDPGLTVPHLSLLSSPVQCQVHPARGSRQPSAAAGSAEQQAGPVGRQGRKRPQLRHGEEDVPPPPQAPRVQVNPNKRYIYDICGKGFSRSDDLRDHRISVHKIGEPWTCHDCDKTYGRKKGLEEHLKTKHSGVYLQECPVLNCDYKCQSKKVLDSHLAQKHGEGEQKFVCPMCKKEFASEYLRDRHVKKNMCQKKKVWRCTECVRSFKSSVEMNHHRARVHTGEEPMVVCNYCKGELANPGSLINHCKLMHPDRSWHLDQAMQRVEEEEEEQEDDGEDQ